MDLGYGFPTPTLSCFPLGAKLGAVRIGPVGLHSPLVHAQGSEGQSIAYEQR